MNPDPHTEVNDAGLIQCIYASAANGEFDHDDLKTLLDVSRTNNAKRGVTGMLLYHENSFFQVLEGEEEEVYRVFNHIKNDPRHTQLVKLIIEPVEERLFADWSMGYANISCDELCNTPGLNDFYSSKRCFTQLQEGRARLLLDQFRSGRWRQRIESSDEGTLSAA